MLGRNGDQPCIVLGDVRRPTGCGPNGIQVSPEKDNEQTIGHVKDHEGLEYHDSVALESALGLNVAGMLGDSASKDLIQKLEQAYKQGVSKYGLDVSQVDPAPTPALPLLFKGTEHPAAPLIPTTATPFGLQAGIGFDSLCPPPASSPAPRGLRSSASGKGGPVGERLMTNGPASALSLTVGEDAPSLDISSLLQKWDTSNLDCLVSDPSRRTSSDLGLAQSYACQPGLPNCSLFNSARRQLGRGLQCAGGTGFPGGKGSMGAEGEQGPTHCAPRLGLDESLGSGGTDALFGSTHWGKPLARPPAYGHGNHPPKGQQENGSALSQVGSGGHVLPFASRTGGASPAGGRGIRGGIDIVGGLWKRPRSGFGGLFPRASSGSVKEAGGVGAKPDDLFKPGSPGECSLQTEQGASPPKDTKAEQVPGVAPAMAGTGSGLALADGSCGSAVGWTPSQHKHESCPAQSPSFGAKPRPVASLPEAAAAAALDKAEGVKESKEGGVRRGPGRPPRAAAVQLEEVEHALLRFREVQLEQALGGRAAAGVPHLQVASPRRGAIPLQAPPDLVPSPESPPSKRGNARKRKKTQDNGALQACQRRKRGVAGTAYGDFTPSPRQEALPGLFVTFMLPPCEPKGGRTSSASNEPAVATQCTFLFQKELTSSDTNVSGRVIMPRIPVEEHLPYVPAKEGIYLDFVSPAGSPHARYTGKTWTFRLKFWMNGTPTLKRMYILESTRSYTKTYSLKSGSVLAFYRAPDGRTVLDPQDVNLLLPP